MTTIFLWIRYLLGQLWLLIDWLETGGEPPEQQD